MYFTLKSVIFGNWKINRVFILNEAQVRNQHYNRNHKYYMVAVDENNRKDLHHEVMMDVAFADDFAF